MVHSHFVAVAEHPFAAVVQTNLARLLVTRGEPAMAEPLIREALATLHNAHGADHWLTADAGSVYGTCLAGLGRHAEAEPLLLAAYPVLKQERGERADYTRDALARIVELYEAWGKPEKAAEYRALTVSSGAAPP